MADTKINETAEKRIKTYVGSAPTFETTGGGCALVCPRCANGYLHQQSVDVFFRHSEDEDGIHVRVKGSKEIKMASCLSHLMGGGRRDNIYIVFYCEDCDAGEPDGSITLHIQQHKGMTYFQWSK